ncbi:MAG: penicillin-binding protein 2 [Candidatus Pacebacteria bacterium]|nr:penicillin-binding protein 2 [Candidatus Paceibacterota bacterium]
MKKPIPYIEDHAWHQRVVFIRFSFSAIFILLLVRLFYWQILQSDKLQAAAESQYTSVKKTTGSRGNIYSSDGHLLVTNRDVYTLFAEPKKFTQTREQIASLLTSFMPVDENVSTELATSSAYLEQTQGEWKTTFLKRLEDPSLQWVSLKRKLPREIKGMIDQLALSGLGFDREEVRYYPEASMAANVLGFVGRDERDHEQGYFGIEGYYDRELRGQEGVVTQEKDALGLPIAIGGYDVIGSRDGRDITLTIRRDLQFLLEEKLKEGMVRYGSKTAEAAIMDPKTGAILAMASFPSYDPAKYYTFDPQTYKNLFVQDVYEPGSTLKILTVSAGIDAGAVSPDTQCDRCTGPRVISGYTIKTWNEKYYPNTTIADGLVHSDNTAMIFVTDKVGKEKFVEYLRSFGLETKTGIDLQEEATPPFRKEWKDIDVATASFGQGIVVTGIQMLSTAQAIANKGLMMRPFLTQSVKQGDRMITIDPRPLRQVISQDTADKVTLMMEAAAQHGDAKWATPKGYRIAGKTGTAQVAVSGHYDDEKTVASFVGFAPADDPKFVMLVKLREPTSSPWGSETAAPLWFSIARDLFIRMKIAPK